MANKNLKYFHLAILYDIIPFFIFHGGTGLIHVVDLGDGVIMQLFTSAVAKA